MFHEESLHRLLCKLWNKSIWRTAAACVVSIDQPYFWLYFFPAGCGFDPIRPPLDPLTAALLTLVTPGPPFDAFIELDRITARYGGMYA